MVHPKQMNVDFPTNTDDEAINSKGTYGKPSDIHTDATSLQFRIEISIIYREIVDSTWESGCDIDELPYDLVLQFDKKLNNFIRQLDRSIERIKKNSLELNPCSTKEKANKLGLLARQRCANNFSIHTRIARLHRPFLIRGAQDPQYAYSRMVCLRSARGVIELTKELMASNDGLDSTKIVAFNHHIFVSTMILVIDYCFNRDEPRGKERKEEILDCFRMLENRQGDNTIASRGIQTLRELVRRRPDNWECQDGGGTEHVIADMELSSYASQKPLEGMGSSEQDLSFAFGGDQISKTFSQQGEEMDLAMFEDINWDAEFDHSQFEALFEKIEGQNKMAQ